MERYNVHDEYMTPSEAGNVVLYDDAQRALDAEREKVAFLEKKNANLIEASNLVLKVKAEQDAQLATLQAQLAAAKKVKADYDRWLSGGVYFTTAEYEKHVADYGQQVQALQAQLRQVEGENELLKSGQRYMALEKERDALRQLVAALPVVDVQEVSVWLSPDESGWLVSKRPAFPAGLYWAKFRTQAEADSFRALLAYRATLAAKDAGKERHE